MHSLFGVPELAAKQSMLLTKNSHSKLNESGTFKGEWLQTQHPTGRCYQSKIGEDK